MSDPRFPRDRVSVVVRRFLDEFRAARPLNQGGDYGRGSSEFYMGAMAWLAWKSGVPERSIHRVVYGPSRSEIEQSRATGEHVTLKIVDRLFCAMNCVHLFVLPAEQGGFADVYLSGLDQLEEAA